MSKTIEQISIATSPPAGRVAQVVTGSKDETSQGGHQFGFKEMAALIGVITVMIGIVGYGIYSQRPRAGSDSSVATIIEPARVSPVDQTPISVGPNAQPVQVSQSTPAPAIPPAKNPEVTATPMQSESLHADVYFDFGKSRLRADATATLQQHVQMLKKDGNWAMLIQGYADQHGPAEYNRTLALRRAESVKQFLVELGVPESSMKVVSLGKESTICDDQTPTCQRLNRRVHVEMVRLETEQAVAPSTTTIGDENNLAQSSDPVPGIPSSDDQSSQEIVPTSPDQP